MSSNFALSSSSSPYSSNFANDGNGVNYIEHQVSKMDTLAGVAIKYGVEVADIKRMNGLATDLQMFALKSLQIPLPGRHPPSPSLSNSATQGDCSIDQMQPRRASTDGLESFQSYRLKSPQRKVSPAMSRLQGYYGLKTPNQRSKPPNPITAVEGTEMAVYRTGSSHHLEDGLFPESSMFSGQDPSQHQGYRDLVNGFLSENNELIKDSPGAGSMNGELFNSNEKYVCMHQKTDADISRTPEMLLKEENSGGTGFLARTGKGLALRPKSASRTNLVADADLGQLKPTPNGPGDSPMPNGFKGVRKSSSTSNLQDQNGDSSIWSTPKWNWTDLSTLSATPVTRPMFDGLPKPITGRRSKAALD